MTVATGRETGRRGRCLGGTPERTSRGIAAYNTLGKRHCPDWDERENLNHAASLSVQPQQSRILFFIRVIDTG